MLILREENKRLKGTKYKLPDKIFIRFKDILLKYPEYSTYTGYVKAKNVIENKGIVTMEWLKNMKAFFEKTDKRDIEYTLGGGELVNFYVLTKLDSLTSETRKEHTNNPTKVRNETSPLTGNIGTHSSKTINVSNTLMNNIIPKI